MLTSGFSSVSSEGLVPTVILANLKRSEAVSLLTFRFTDTSIWRSFMSVFELSRKKWRTESGVRMFTFYYALTDKVWACSHGLCWRAVTDTHKGFVIFLFLASKTWMNFNLFTLVWGQFRKFWTFFSKPVTQLQMLVLLKFSFYAIHSSTSIRLFEYFLSTR